MVYARTDGDRTYTFIVSGMLWRNSMIMQDLETGSLWSHITGEALHGSAAGSQLEALPSVQTTWAEWVRKHPDTAVLKKDKTITSSSYEDYFSNPEQMGLFRGQWLSQKMAGKAFVHGLTRGPHALAVPDTSIRGLIEARLAEERILIWRASDGGVRAYVAEANEQSIRMVPIDTRLGRDRDSGSLWDLDSGECLSGPLTGTRLESVPITTAYWFAWSAFYPNTLVVE